MIVSQCTNGGPKVIAYYPNGGALGLPEHRREKTYIPGCVTEAVTDLGGGKLVEEVGSQGFVTTVVRLLGMAEVIVWVLHELLYIYDY